MSLGSFLQGIISSINPFGGGGGNAQAQQKKKQQQQNNAPQAPRPVQQQQNNQSNIPKPQSTQNLFQGINNDLGIKPVTNPVNSIPVVKNPSLAPLQTQQTQPGAIIKPNTTPQPTVPQPSNNTPSPQQHENIFDRIGNTLKTTAQTIGAVGTSLPEVALGAGRVVSGVAQGLTQLPHVVTSLAATGTHALNSVAPAPLKPLTNQFNNVAQGINTGTKAVTNVVQTPFNIVNKGLDTAAQAYNKAVPGPGDIGIGNSVYKESQIPLQVIAGLLTLGSGTAAEGAGAVGDASEGGGLFSKLGNFVNKPISSGNSTVDNVISNTANTTRKFTNPVVQAVNSPFGTAKNGITQLINNRTLPTAAQEEVGGGELGNIVGNEVPPTQIPVSTGVNVNAPETPPTNVPVTVNPSRPGQPIIEVGGDTPGRVAVPTAQETANQRAANAFNNQTPGLPDQRIEGVTPTNTGNTGAFTQAEIQQEQKALDEALANGEINKTTHKAASNELNSLTAVDVAPKGQRITVKQQDSIPVTTNAGSEPTTPNTVTVPTNVQTTPGTVRPTTAEAPANAEAAATTPSVAPPAALSKDVQNVLDNPKTFTKAQVKSARNQRALANKMAKTQEDTAAAITRIDNAKPTGDKSFVSSGEFRKGAQGNISEVAHKDLEAAQAAHDTTNLSIDDVLQQARDEVNQNGIHSPETVRNLKAIRDSGTLARTSPEFKAVNDEYKSAISNHARALSMTDRTARTSATGDQLANRFTSKLLSSVDDSGKISDGDIAQVTQAENAFTQARDNANAAGETFKASGSQRAFKEWKTAQQTAEKADRRAKITEYLVSKRALAGNKNMEAVKAIQDAEKNAGVYSMDAIDSNMLSGTGTMVRNYINTLFPRAENKVFGRASSVIAKKLTGVDAVGGSSGRGARIGSAIGKDVYKADLAARKEAGVGFIRRAVTAGNTIGEKNIEATTYSKAFSHYKQLLKSEGYKGSELNNRAEFNVRTDPDGLVEQYRNDTLQANALSGLTHGDKIENKLSNAIQKMLADAGVGHTGQVVGRTAAKAVSRVGLGFPTVIARSLVEGLKRATVGIPEVGWSTMKFLKTGDKEAYAGELTKAMQHAGTGGGLILLGRELGKMGVISGPYPKDPATRAQWTAEGKQEGSINIGGNWFNIPGYLGGFALPLMVGAATNDVKSSATASNIYQTILGTSPVTDIQSTLGVLTGSGTAATTKNAATSLIRSVTPAGSFVAELAKMTDPTANDTTKKSAAQNILDSIAGGIPFLNNKVNTTPKVDAYGNVIKNPNPIAIALGAQGSTQKQGTADVQQQQNTATKTLQELQQFGVTNNKDLMGLISPQLKQELANGTQLSPADVVKVQNAVTKGVSPTQDSNWRQEGKYNTDKAALQVKLQMLNADATAKPSEKDAINQQIATDTVLNSNNVPYDTYKLYKTTTLAEWRAMGEPTNAAYDPKTYQTLWTLDQALTKAGASTKTNAPTVSKFSAKAPSTGSKSNGFTTDIGTIKPSSFSPTVQAYQTIAQSAGSVPVIAATMPNIVHNISHSG